MFDGNWRQTVEKGVDPIGEGLRKMGISADMLTVVGILMSVATAFVIGNGYLRWGFVAMLATGIPDLLDGAVAKASGSASKPVIAHAELSNLSILSSTTGFSLVSHFEFVKPQEFRRETYSAGFSTLSRGPLGMVSGGNSSSIALANEPQLAWRD